MPASPYSRERSSLPRLLAVERPRALSPPLRGDWRIDGGSSSRDWQRGGDGPLSASDWARCGGINLTMSGPPRTCAGIQIKEVASNLTLFDANDLSTCDIQSMNLSPRSDTRYPINPPASFARDLPPPPLMRRWHWCARSGLEHREAWLGMYRHVYCCRLQVTFRRRVFEAAGGRRRRAVRRHTKQGLREWLCKRKFHR